MQPKQMPNFDTSGLSLVPKEKSSEQPKIISASEQEALDVKYAVPKSPERYVDEPKNLIDEPNKGENLESTISKIGTQPTQKENEMTDYTKRRNEVKGEAASLDKKTESFEKSSKSLLVGSAVSTVAAFGTWIGAGSVAGGAAILPILAPIAAPVILGAGIIAVASFSGALILKLLKNRAQNKKDNLVNDNRAMFQYN